MTKSKCLVVHLDLQKANCLWHSNSPFPLSLEVFINISLKFIVWCVPRTNAVLGHVDRCVGCRMLEVLRHQCYCKVYLREVGWTGMWQWPHTSVFLGEWNGPLINLAKKGEKMLIYGPWLLKFGFHGSGVPTLTNQETPVGLIAALPKNWVTCSFRMLFTGTHVPSVDILLLFIPGKRKGPAWEAIFHIYLWPRWSQVPFT